MATALTVSSAQAHDGSIRLRAFGSATIDGVFTGGEWDAAGKWDFAANVPPTGTAPATLYAMNDGSTLFLAIKVARPGVAQSFVSFTFDNDHDGLVGEPGDDGLAINQGLYFADNFYSPCQGGICGYGDTGFGGTSDGQGTATNQGMFSYYEFSHPLDTTDDAHDFSLRFGKVVGFEVFLQLCDQTCVNTSSSRGDIVVTSTSTVAPDTRITIGPAQDSLTREKSGSVEFTGSDDAIAPEDLTFECQLDEGGFAHCTSPAPYELDEGRHSFAVRATDEVGNIDPTPDVRSWIIDTAAPSKPSVRGPRKLRQSRAVYTLSARDSIDTAAQLRYRCSVDRRSLKPCSRRLVVRLKRGRHVLRVRAVDRVGHVSALTVVRVVRKKPPRRVRH